ncbi:hypothetical protein V502_05485 [Pseudogymnoascus sp. VKM F-4520 (FW-2644)]|nr:hypothetical protein V502_05485 [Pseudogymnoascus sp. VKM F-4520 (FW-2644)]
MQLVKISLLLLPLIAAASAVVDNTPLNVQAKIRHDQGLMNRGLDTASAGLEKRACEKNGCKCAKNTPQGAYCGLCKAVTESGKGAFYTRDIFECSPSGACCSYGSATIYFCAARAPFPPRSTLNRTKDDLGRMVPAGLEGEESTAGNRLAPA